MRKWLLVVVVLVLSGVLISATGGTPGLASPPDRQLTQTDSPMVTLTANATVRAWPSDQTEIIGEIPARSMVVTNGRTTDAQWWRIPYPGGPDGNGWVRANVVEPNAAAANVPVIEVVFATATPAPVPPTATPLACIYNAAYVTDVTIPDHTQIQAAQQFDKVWRMSNTGSCNWEQGTALVFVSGFKMSAPDTTTVPVTAPGGTADIGVTMFAPANPGTYEGVWQLRSPQGEFFGSRVTVVIDVPNPNPPAPQPTATPVPPQPSQPYINFWADTDQVNEGQCTNIHWDVRNVQAVYLQYIGHSDGVTGQGDRWVCPSTDGKRYTLVVYLVDGSQTTRELQININHDGPTPTPTPHHEDRYINVSVNPQQINKGDCTTVTWDVGELHKIFFDNHKFTSHQGSYNWCPKESTRTNFEVCYESSCGDRKDVSVSVTVK